MFEDWIKVGDVMIYDSIFGGACAIVVLSCDDIEMTSMRVDNFGGARRIDVHSEKAWHPNWNKKSHWEALGWKFK